MGYTTAYSTGQHKRGVIRLQMTAAFLHMPGSCIPSSVVFACIHTVPAANATVMHAPYGVWVQSLQDITETIEHDFYIPTEYMAAKEITAKKPGPRGVRTQASTSQANISKLRFQIPGAYSYVRPW